ncbi:hypothetical protein POM88_001029 [Heracleum sosnowskyi]|uniref:Uncharacterized protein n=1 Tax=Heracleum sosnowskyi TaxID=360622 RepID=A0AAD8JC74_9APIA|nr:hypothetical protein POM88_001029 [Heracleum sosnowskyi]
MQNVLYVSCSVWTCLSLVPRHVTDVRAELLDIGYDLNTIHSLVSGLLNIFSAVFWLRGNDCRKLFPMEVTFLVEIEKEPTRATTTTEKQPKKAGTSREATSSYCPSVLIILRAWC